MSDHPPTKIVISHDTSKLGGRPPKKPEFKVVIVVILVFIGAFLILVQLEDNLQPSTQPTKIRPTSTPIGPFTCQFTIPSAPYLGQALEPRRDNAPFLYSFPKGTHQSYFLYPDEQFRVIYTARCSDESYWLYVRVIEDSYFYWEFPESGYLYKDERIHATFTSPSRKNQDCAIDTSVPNHTGTFYTPASLFNAPGETQPIITFEPNQHGVFQTYATANCNDGSVWSYIVTQGRNEGWLETSDANVHFSNQIS